MAVIPPGRSLLPGRYQEIQAAAEISLHYRYRAIAAFRPPGIDREMRDSEKE